MCKENSANILMRMYQCLNWSSLGSRFARAERELHAARPFGYGPRKFYQSSQLVKGPVDDRAESHHKGEKKKPATAQAQPEPEPELKPEQKEAEKKLKRLYIAMTSDRGEV